MDHITTYIVAFALAVPLILYVWAAFRAPQSKVSTSAGYFVAYRQVGTAPFANSSLAYAFQVATLFPFLYWGVQGQFLPAIINAVCWGIGIFLFRCCLTPILDCLTSQSKPRTLHGLLGETYKSVAVQRVAAGVTISGMIGMALAEAYWGMQILKVVVPEDTPAYYAVVFGTLLFVLAYVWYGGTWGSIRTDMFQLMFSYIGFTIVLLFAIYIVASSRGILSPAAAIVSILMLVSGLWAFGIRIRQKIKPLSGMGPSDDANTSDTNDWLDKFLSRLSRGLSNATLISIFVSAISFGVILVQHLHSTNLARFLDPGDPKWLGVAALAFMPLGFQFVDMGAWQRLQSIGGSKTEAKNYASRGLLLYVVESPFSWIMCAALGMLIVATVPQLATVTDKAGPLAAYPRILIESGLFVQLGVAVAFMMGVMGVMLSTIDSVLLAAMYAFVADFRGCQFLTEASEPISEKDKEQDRRELLSGKRAAFLFIISVCVGLIFLSWTLSSPDKLIGVMVGFYGAMLSLLPAVALMLLRAEKKPSGTSIVAGIIGGVISSLFFTIWGLFNPDRSWWAVFTAPGIATLPILSSLLAAIYRGYHNGIIRKGK